MSQILQGSSVYDPSEIEFSITPPRGESFAPYGFAQGEKLFYKDGCLFIRLHSTSDSNAIMSGFYGRDLQINFSHKTKPSFQSLGNILSQLTFKLDLYSFSVGDTLGEIVWRFSPT